MGLDDLLRLGHKQLPVVIQQPVEGLQDVGGGQVELVQDDPVAFPHGVDENTCGVEGEAGEPSDAGHAGVQQGGWIKKCFNVYSDYFCSFCFCSFYVFLNYLICTFKINRTLYFFSFLKLELFQPH